MDDLTPERPRAAGVPEEVPDAVTAIEGARILANDARDRLRADGFTDAQIDEWADAFIAERGSGEVEDLVAWIAEREQQSG